MCTLGYVLGNIEKAAAGVYEGITNFMERKQWNGKVHGAVMVM